jgi:hypothetical protein
MEELSQNFSELQNDFEQFSDDTSATLDEHSQSIADATEKSGQLDFPLTADSIDRIKEVFPTGIGTLVAGTIVINDTRINASNTIMYSVTTSSGTGTITAGLPHLTYSYVLGNGTVTFNSSVNTDTSTIGYVIF